MKTFLLMLLMLWTSGMSGTAFHMTITGQDPTQTAVFFAGAVFSALLTLAGIIQDR